MLFKVFVWGYFSRKICKREISKNSPHAKISMFTVPYTLFLITQYPKRFPYYPYTTYDIQNSPYTIPHSSYAFPSCV